jgi:hypothetical protein
LGLPLEKCQIWPKRERLAAKPVSSFVHGPSEKFEGGPTAPADQDYRFGWMRWADAQSRRKLAHLKVYLVERTIYLIENIDLYMERVVSPRYQQLQSLKLNQKLL